MAACPSCRQLDADACSYPSEARPGCLLDKRKREALNAGLGPATIQYTRAKVKLRVLFPDATRIEINPQWLEVAGLPLLLLLTLAQVLKVLMMVWGDDADITLDFSAAGELLRIERGKPRK